MRLSRLLVAAWRRLPGPLLRASYRSTTAMATAALMRAGAVAVYARGSFATARIVPGVSDVDLIAVVDDSGTDLRVRWEQLRRRIPMARIIDVAVYRREDVADVMAGPTHVSGLERGRARVHRGPRVPPIGPLVRPGLHGPAAEWRLLRGKDVRPPHEPWPEQVGWLAAWLELGHWWGHAHALVARPDGPQAPYLALRLVSESARIWLWIIHRIAAGGAEDVLARTADRLPTSSPALALAERLARRPRRMVDVDPAVVLAWLTDRSVDVADELSRRAELEGGVRVALVGVPASGATAPLVDWRALVVPLTWRETVTLAAGDPANPDARARARAGWKPGSYLALRRGNLVTLPAPRFQPGMLRNAQCAVSDPVTLAVLDGRAHATFGGITGWSARDVATRAVREHAAVVSAPPAAFWESGGLLLTAARAGLFHDSLGTDRPELCVDYGAVLDRLGHVDRRFRALASTTPEAVVGGGVDHRLVAILHGAVTALASYRDPP